jgi:nucleolar protein 12
MSGLLVADAADSAVSNLFGKQPGPAPPVKKKKKKKSNFAEEELIREVEAEDLEGVAEDGPAPPVDEVDAPPAAGAKGERKEKEDDGIRLARTVFVGNVPVGTGVKQLRKHFASFGAVESVRFRAAAAENPKMPQKAAVIKGELTGEALCAYVVFDAQTSCARAIAASGQVAFGRHLRIDAASAAGEGSAAGKLHDTKKSVFLGNLPHEVSDEALWSLFSPCGRIAYVRIIREQRTQVGKGFGYVGFHEAGSVERALALHGTKIAEKTSEHPVADGKDKTPRERAIRVFRCSAGKSHARMTERSQEPPPSKKAKSVPPAGEGARSGKPANAATVAAALGADSQQRKGVGWQQRVRRRLHKKLEGRKAVRTAAAIERKARFGTEGKRLQSAIAKKSSAKKAASSNSSKPAKEKRESKDKALAKRARSKAAKRERDRPSSKKK